MLCLAESMITKTFEDSPKGTFFFFIVKEHAALLKKYLKNEKIKDVLLIAQSLITKTFENHRKGPSSDCKGTCCHSLPSKNKRRKTNKQD